ncbi:MAG TPA: hypothetical protein VF064_15800 [Pyrinomonadaceae bacterium]
MKYCPDCGESYDDREKFCELDGTPLVAAPETVALRGGRQASPWLLGAAGLAVGLSVCAVALLIYYFATRGDGADPRDAQPAGATRIAEFPPPSGAAREVPTPEPDETTPTPTETPTPTPTPAQTPAPAAPESPLRMLRDAPASTDPQPGQRFVIGLHDGTDIVADDAWRAADGVWYRRGSLVTLLDPARIRSIERQQQQQQQQQTPEP